MPPRKNRTRRNPATAAWGIIEFTLAGGFRLAELTATQNRAQVLIELLQGEADAVGTVRFGVAAERLRPGRPQDAWLLRRDENGFRTYRLLFMAGGQLPPHDESWREVALEKNTRWTIR